MEYEIARIDQRAADLKERMESFNAELKAAKANKASLTTDEQQQLISDLKRKREREQRLHEQYGRKQDKLLFVAMYILMNLAEDPTVERKMLKKDLMSFLSGTLLSSRSRSLTTFSSQ